MRWPNLSGAELRGTLPVTEAFVNGLVREHGAPSSKFARLRSVAFLEGDIVRPEFEVGPSFLSKTLAPELHIEGVRGPPSAPVLELTVPAQYAVALSGILRKVDSRGDLVAVERRTVRLHLVPILARIEPRLPSLLPLLRHLEVRTERARLLVDFELVAPFDITSERSERGST